MGEQVVTENAYALILCIAKDYEREAALEALGVETPNANKGKESKLAKIPNSEADAIYKYYYDDKMTLDVIGKKYEVTAVTVKNFLVRNGIPIKRKGRYTE